MKDASPANQDFRIFGYDQQNRLRANLYYPAGHPYAGAMYSWLVCRSEREMAYKLAEQWEQSLSEEEFEVLEALEGEIIEVPCEDCGGSGIDAGGISAVESEDCRSCNGTGRETIPTLVGFGSSAPAPRIASIGNGLYIKTRKAVA